MRKPETDITNTQSKNEITLESLCSSIQDDLDKIEEKLKTFTKSSNLIVSEINSYLFQKTGKRIRPVLLVLCSKLFKYKGNEHIFLSALIETMHTASLIHDDIIDNSKTRRGLPTPHTKWGPNIAVLLGDYLYIKSLYLSLKNSSKEINQLVAEFSAKMIEGELNEYYMSRNLNIKEKDYLDIISKKTASLFCASCQIGSILGYASEKEKKILGEFGTNLGISFQIIDDILDYTADEKTLGKPVLSDLSEGRITLPLIFTLNNDGKENRKRLIELLKIEKLGDNPKKEILNIVKSNGALDYSYKKAQIYSMKSKEIINQFPKSIYKNSLALIPDFNLNRKK